MDLIERQAAIDAMTNTLWHYPNECYRNLNEYEFAKGLSELGLKSVPSAQQEIIRCRDCKHNPKHEWFGCPMSHLNETQRPETAWCWKGERREDED